MHGRCDAGSWHINARKRESEDPFPENYRAWRCSATLRASSFLVRLVRNFLTWHGPWSRGTVRVGGGVGVLRLAFTAMPLALTHTQQLVCRLCINEVKLGAHAKCASVQPSSPTSTFRIMELNQFWSSESPQLQGLVQSQVKVDFDQFIRNCLNSTNFFVTNAIHSFTSTLFELSESISANMCRI